MDEKEILKLICQINRFDDKEKGVDYYSGWDQALDTVTLDIKAFFAEKYLEQNNGKD